MDGLYLNWNLVLLVPGSSGIVYNHPFVAAWVGDPSANTASVANTCVSGPLLPSSIPSFFLLPTSPNRASRQTWSGSLSYVACPFIQPMTLSQH